MVPYKLQESHQLRIQSELKFQFSRSSGPGGQKVNKTETRVELLWSLVDSSSFNEDQKNLLKQKLSHRMNKMGLVQFYSDRYRTREQNKDHCLRKLFVAIEKALTVQKKRKATKPTRASKEKRLSEKKRHGDKKKMRQKVD